MVLQKSISTFFKPLPMKRSLSSSADDPASKKVKNVDAATADCSGAAEFSDKLRAMCVKCPVLRPDIGDTWFSALKEEFGKPYFRTLSQFVCTERAQYTVYPPEDKVWTWTQMCPVSAVKVVILGQDPYHGPGQAHGLCFSVMKGITAPPSLQNMYRELSTDTEGFEIPSHGNLCGWARQGVLLLNACLTVRANCANSHKDKGWEQLTDAVIKHISSRSHGVVFLLWGAYAQNKARLIDQKKHHLLKTVHPSPLSAHRGFFGCKHFSKCNEMLQQSGKRPINWADLPLE